MVESEAKKIRECVRTGRYEDALSVELDASRPAINRAHMKLLARFRDRPEVRAFLNEAKSLITCESELEKGRRLTRIGKKEEAARYLVSGLKKRGTADDYLLTGQTLEQTWRREEALPYFERAVELRGDPTDYLWLGTALSHLERYDQAQPVFEKAVKLRGSADDRRLLGSIYLKTGNLKNAEHQLRAAIALGDAISSRQLLIECAAKMSRQKLETTFRAFFAVTVFVKKHPIASALACAALTSAVVLACLG